MLTTTLELVPPSPIHPGITEPLHESPVKSPPLVPGLKAPLSEAEYENYTANSVKIGHTVLVCRDTAPQTENKPPPFVSAGAAKRARNNENKRLRELTLTEEEKRQRAVVNLDKRIRRDIKKGRREFSKRIDLGTKACIAQDIGTDRELSRQCHQNTDIIFQRLVDLHNRKETLAPRPYAIPIDKHKLFYPH